MTRGDKFLIASICIISFLSYVVLFGQYFKYMETRYILIKAEGKVAKTIKMSGNTNPKVYTFYFDDIEINLEVNKNKIRMLPMDKKICPKQICSKIGWISRPYQRIICLPNKIVVSITGQTPLEVDEISM